MTNVKTSLKSLFLALVAISAAHVHAQAGDKPGYLIGCITDAETGAGINEVRVALSSASYSTEGYSFTAGACGDGLYYVEIPYAKVGTYTATYSKAGYIEQQRTVTISSGSGVRLDISLSLETGYLSVTSTPSGASITIDGSSTGQVTPYTFTKRVGMHTVSVSKEGYITPPSQTISVSKDATTEVSFALEAKAYGVSLSADRLSDTVNVSVQAVYTLTISNTGNVQDTFDLAFSAPAGVSASLNASSITLDPGAQGSVVLRVSSSTAGIYTVSVTASSRSSPSASASVSLTTTVVVPPSYGVSLSADKVYASVKLGSSALYSLVLSNTGNVRDTFTLSRTDLVGGSVSGLPSQATLDAGSSATISMAITPGVGGDNVVVVTASSQGDPSKSSSVSTTTFAEVYGVSLSTNKVSDSVLINEEAVYTLTVANLGNVRDTFTLVHTAPAGAAVSVNQSSISLRQGAAGTVTLRVSSPSVGEYVVSVTATSQGDASKSASITTTTLVSLPKEYGVFLSADKLSDEAQVGSEAVYSLTVKNTGNTQDTYDIYHSAPAAISASLSQSSVSLSSGASSVITFKVKSSVEGVYSATVTARSRTNPSVTAAITVTTTFRQLASPLLKQGLSLLKQGLPPLEALNEFQLIDLMEREGDTASTIFAFSAETAPLAAVYAAGGEIVLSSEMAEKMLSLRPNIGSRLNYVTGGDVYELAAHYAIKRYPNASVAIMVRGDLAVDGLVAVPLAARLNAPILLVKTNEIPAPVSMALERGYEKIYIVGGPVAVSASVSEKLKTFSKEVVRLWGATRFETSIEVTKEFRRLGDATQAILTLGERPAIYSVALASRYKVPLLYLDARLKPEKMNKHQRAVSAFISDARLGVRTIYVG